MNQEHWKIWVDTGGTFTDCIGSNNRGSWQRIKVLSDGSLRATITEVVDDKNVKIQHQWPIKTDILRGYTFTLIAKNQISSKIVSFSPYANTLTFENPISNQIKIGDDFRITAFEEAPILAVRIITETMVEQKVSNVDMKLGSTKGTNALLEKKGAKVALIVTKGFKDLLEIGSQQRSNLFDLRIKKAEQLYTEVFEVPERINASGEIITPLHENEISNLVDQVTQSSCETVAIGLINSYRNPKHEILIYEKLRKIGFNFVSSSAALAPSISILPRATTAVVNAYLDPIISNYLSGIKEKLTDSHLKVMTSAGGLSDHQFFQPKDSLLSGPAGGVVGASIIGKQIGISKIIAFDMGGTSTDVSRYDNGFDYQFESKIGDATLLSPSLAIETVAAGGGSICDFDGFKLTVGPISAGAFPGPACYGCGGPLTITDVNFLLGRLDENGFSIPLNKSAAEEALEKLLSKITSGGAVTIDKVQVLQGFLAIANEKMAETIKKISISKGFDPVEYNLLAFGGAGAQHACEIAGLLGMHEVVIPYNAGILSAYGIGNAAVERYAQKEILKPLDDFYEYISDTIDSLKKEASQKLRQEGIAATEIQVNYSKVFLRISGQDNSIGIDYLNGENLKKRFLEAYTKLFHHSPSKKELEIVSIKCIASSQQIIPIPNHKIGMQPEPKAIRHINSNVSGERVKIPVYRWESLPAHQKVVGSCLVISENSTVFIPLHWEFELDENDNLLLSNNSANSVEYNEAAFQALSLELYTNRFRGLVDEMGARLRRTAFSVNIKERLDFSCALLDRYGELIVNAPHIPVHLGSLGICVRSLVKSMELAPGDVVITNHPAYGGSHLPDITLVKPVFDSNQHLIGYLANRAHHSEIGGKRPGSMPPDAKNLEEEGVIIKPRFLVKGGSPKWNEIEDLLKHAPFPSRSVAENIADLQAGLASLSQGELSLLKMVMQFGKNAIFNAMGAIKNQSSEIIQNALKKFEGVSFNVKEHLDDGWEINIKIAVKNKHATLNFSETSQRHPKNFNATPAIVYSAVLYVFRLMTKKNIPLNEGILKAFTIILPECFLNPKFSNDDTLCPAVVGGNTETSQRLVDTLIKGFKLAACSQGTMNNLLFGNEEFGYYETIGGGVGATEGNDGASAIHQHMTNTRITDPEILEFRYPVSVNRFAIRKSSGGKGKWRGGDGIERELTFHQEVELTILSQHRVHKPYGMAGGDPGMRGEQFVIRNSGEKITLNGVDALKMFPNDKIVIKTPGGGGYGN